MAAPLESLKDALRDPDTDQRPPKRKKAVPQAQLEESLKLIRVEPRGPFCPGCGSEQSGGEPPEHFWPEVTQRLAQEGTEDEHWVTVAWPMVKTEAGIFCGNTCVERRRKRLAGEPNWMGCGCREPCEYCADGVRRVKEIDRKAKDAGVAA